MSVPEDFGGRLVERVKKIRAQKQAEADKRRQDEKDKQAKLAESAAKEE